MQAELGALYAAFREGRPSPLPELAVQYADFAVWQREQLQGEMLERQVAYWKAQLAGAPALLELPTDRPRPAVQSYRGARERVDLSAGLAERLAALEADPEAAAFFATLGGQKRFAFLFRLQQLKRPESRERRIREYVALLREGRTLT